MLRLLSVSSGLTPVRPLSGGLTLLRRVVETPRPFRTLRTPSAPSFSGSSTSRRARGNGATMALQRYVQNTYYPDDDSVQGRPALRPPARPPQEVVGDIFSKAQEQSALMTLGRQVPVGINETVVRVGDQFPEAGQVGTGTTLEDREGAEKPVSG